MEEFSRELHLALQKRSKPRRRFILWSAFVAGLLTLIFLISPWSPTNKDIVLAMGQTVQNLQNYHGILEKINTNGAGESQVIQRTEIWSEANKYATRSKEGTITVNNGERRWMNQPKSKEITLLPVYLDSYDFDLQKEALKAQEYPHKVVGQDVIAGRSATRIEIDPPGGLPYYLWIEPETHLPVQLQTAMQKSVQTTYTFVMSESKAVSPFVPAPLAVLGQSANGPIEVLPDSLRWQQNGLDIQIQGQQSEELAKQLTSNLIIPQGNPALPTQPSVKVEIDMDVVQQNQQQVDAGSSPWQLDPMQVAFTFAALKISPSGVTGTPRLISTPSKSRQTLEQTP